MASYVVIIYDPNYAGADVTITLDTTPPAIVWGDPQNPVGGERMVVSYTTDEAVARAEITLHDGRILPVAVFSDRLEVDLPEDTPEGTAQLRAYDSVDNYSSLVVTLVGETGPVEPPTPGPAGTGGMPDFGDQRLHHASRVRITSRTRIDRGHRVRSGSGVTTRSTTRVRSHAASGGATPVAGRSGMEVRLATASEASVASATTIHRRDEDIEAIVALGLL